MMKKNKIKLYMDCDNTLVNSTRSYTNVYNWMFAHNKKRDAVWEDVRRWDLKDECPRIKRKGVKETPEEEKINDVKLVNDIFGNERFFNTLEFYPEMFHLMYEYAVIFSDIYEVYIVSKGDEANLKLKREWIHTNMPFIKKDNILLLDNSIGMSKSSIDMSDGIIVDDHQDCISSSNAKWKILFSYKDILTEWNKEVYYKELRAHDAESLRMNIQHIAEDYKK